MRVTYGQHTSYWVDQDEDPGGEEFHANSCHGTDGDYGKADGNSDWYGPGSHANLTFNHEYQHLCYCSSIGVDAWYTAGFPNELFSTASEYLSGTSSESYFWEPLEDVPCDRGLLLKAYPQWRLFATYILHQFNPDPSEYTDDLLFEWVNTRVPGYSQDRGMRVLAAVLEQEPWSSKLSGENGTEKLYNLFQDWSIAKAINDTTRMAPGDSITLGFGRSLSPYWDLGLFRDVQADCAHPNSGILPNEHVLGDTCLNKFNWVAEYVHPSDSLCSVASDPVSLFNWGSDYILFKVDPADTSFQSGGPYDLKIQIRGLEGNQLPLGYGERLQLAVVTYDSVDSVFRSGADVVEVREVDVSPDSAKANVTIHGFGGPVKAALVILGLAGPDPRTNGDLLLGMWYKYGYTVEKHWKSGAVPWNVTWFDSIHVNGDVSVGEDKTVTIEPGTRVEFYPGDTESGGLDSTVSELILLYPVVGTGGRVVAEGAVNDTILFTSGAGTPGNGDWYGVRVAEGSTFEPKYCRFEHAAYPLICDGGTLTVDSCLIRAFGCVGVWATDTSTVTVEDSWLDQSEDLVGIRIMDGSSGVVARNHMSSAGVGAVGVDVLGGGSATVSYNVMSGMYTGIEVAGGTLTALHNSISAFRNAGIKATGSQVALSYDTVDIGTTGVTGIELVDCPDAEVSHNVITGSSSGLHYGMKCSGSTSAAVSYNRFDDMHTGLKAYGISDLDLTDNVFADNASIGVSAEGSCALTARGNSIEGYTYYGVSVKNYASVDMNAEPESGGNRIPKGAPTSNYCVLNKITTDVVEAENNWWGSSTPLPSYFSGPVDWEPYLSSDPGLPFAARLPRPPDVPAVAYVLQNYPNPLNPVATVEYGVPEDGTRVRLRVFDITGRAVKVLVDAARPAGVHVVRWDGCGNDGRRVASGVYLRAVEVGEYSVTKKMVVLR